jgi:ankyrin repeat protein
MNPEQQLHLAVKEKDIKKIEELLKTGVDINCLFYGWTPLQYAVSQGNLTHFSAEFLI